MTLPFSPPSYRFVLCAACIAFLGSVSVVFAGDYVGPVFPEDTLVVSEIVEPLPLPMPKRNPLLQRPANKQVVFDDLDPVGFVLPHSLVGDDGTDFQSQIVQPRQTTSRTISMSSTSNAIFTDEGEWIQEETVGEYPLDEYPCEMDGCVAAPFLVPFGMGLFDNISVFGDVTTFKTTLNRGTGSLGFSEGVNWSAAVTPQGAAVAQYGARGVQGDMFDRPARSQLFMTAGIFKRFEFPSVQGGIVVDWLQDTSRQFKTVNLQQVRSELSTRVFNDIECGFMGAFGVFGNHPIRGDSTIRTRDYYLVFVRKPLACGQAEIRCGATERGEFLMSTLCEIAINDRLAVHGGLTMLCPQEGQSHRGNLHENWAMSMGVVLYFRGGATCKQTNPYRPMFDVAGNNSFFTKIVRR